MEEKALAGRVSLSSATCCRVHVVGARISSERAKERLKRQVIATKEAIRLDEGSFPSLDSAIENVSDRERYRNASKSVISWVRGNQGTDDKSAFHRSHTVVVIFAASL